VTADRRFDLLVAGGTVVSSTGRFRGDIGVRAGQIAVIAADLRAAPHIEADRIIDATGCFVLPGLIDAHVHPVHAESMATASEAAVFGGVTTLLHHLYVDQQRPIGQSVADAIAEGEATSLADFGLHVRLTDVKRRLDEIPDAVQLGVRSFKLFTAYRKAGIMSTDAELFAAMERIATFGGLPMVHAESGWAIDLLEDRFRASGRTGPLDYPQTRPTWTEVDAVGRVLTLARVAGSAVYLVHISCAEAFPEIVAARERGQTVYAETCPHYLTLTAEDSMLRFGGRAKIAPPLRTTGDIEQLWRFVRNGTVDVIGSDHSAFSSAEKDQVDGDIFDVGFGAPGIETMLTVVNEDGVNRGRIYLEDIVRAIAEAPARIFGLSRKGRLVPGADADLIVFDPEAATVLSDKLHGKAYYSLYSGRSVRGLPRTVVQRGRVLVHEGRLEGSPGSARFVRPDSNNVARRETTPRRMEPVRS